MLNSIYSIARYIEVDIASGGNNKIVRSCIALNRTRSIETTNRDVQEFENRSRRTIYDRYQRFCELSIRNYAISKLNIEQGTSNNQSVICP